MDGKTPPTVSEITTMACWLQDKSGYTELDPEQTWHLDDHLTSLQQRQFTASNELFALAHEMGQIEEAAKAPTIEKAQAAFN